MIGVAWPSVRDTFRLEQGQVAILFLASGASYFLSSFFTGKLLSLWGIGFLLAVSSALVAGSQFGFGLAPAWAIFALMPLAHGLGSGAIDAGLNHYAAHHFSARHMNWLHACYSLGATFGTVIMTSVLVWFGSWRTGYLTVGAILFVLAVLFIFTKRRWDDPGTDEGEQQPAAPLPMSAALGHSLIWLQVVFFFVYTGLELTVGQWAFTILTESRQIPKETAGLWVTIYWGSIAGGRVLFGFVVDRLGIDRLLRLSIAASVVGAILFWLRPAEPSSAISLSLIGFGLAAIYPCMMTRTPQRIGKALAAHAIGFQVSAAMLGAAALPSLSGLFAQEMGLEAVSVAAIAMAAALLLLHEVILFRSKERQPV